MAKKDNPLKRETASILSPLRYPGSKRRLAGYIRHVLELNKIRPSLFVEPFAGGASVSLQLLNDNAVETVGLIDLDPLIASFWHTVFFDTEWLIDQVRSIPVTLDQWNAFKSQATNGWEKQSRNPMELKRKQALAGLFLNRTSYSGIMTSRD